MCGEFVRIDSTVIVYVNIVERWCIGQILHFPAILHMLRNPLGVSFGEFLFCNRAVAIQSKSAKAGIFMPIPF